MTPTISGTPASLRSISNRSHGFDERTPIAQQRTNDLLWRGIGIDLPHRLRHRTLHDFHSGIGRVHSQSAIVVR